MINIHQGCAAWDRKSLYLIVPVRYWWCVSLLIVWFKFQELSGRIFLWFGRMRQVAGFFCDENCIGSWYWLLEPILSLQHATTWFCSAFIVWWQYSSHICMDNCLNHGHWIHVRLYWGNGSKLESQHNATWSMICTFRHVRANIV